jgi:hypothetical protein
MNAAEVQQGLLDTIIRAAQIKAEWELLRTKVLSNERLPRPIRLAVELIAIRAEEILDGMADHVIWGFEHLEDGLLTAAWQEWGKCQNEMSLIQAADRTVSRLVRKSFSETQHGQ